MTSKSWFREQFIARAIAATVWTVILQFPLVLVLKSLFGGYHGIWNYFSSMLYISSIFSCIPILLSILVIAFIHLKYYRVEPLVYPTRWAMLKEFASPSFILLLALNSTITGVLVLSYFKTSGVPLLSSLSKQCSERNSWCLNEAHLYGVMFGAWLGLCESWNYYYSDRRLVKIPPVQQHVKATVWSNVVPLIKTSLIVSARKYLAFFFLYLMIGGSMRSYVLTVTRLGLDEPMDTVIALLSVSLALRCIIIGSAAVFTIRLSNLLFQLFEIKPVTFPIVRFSEESIPLLQEAMNSNEELLRLWACRDWNILAEQSEERRLVIFSVSEPGNHPHNWDSIVSAVLPQCVKFIASLRGEIPAAKTVIPSTVPQSPPPYDPITSPTRLRSMALKSPVRTVQSPEEKPKSSLQDRVDLKFQEIVESFKKKPIIHFLWGELPDAKRRQNFAKAESVIQLIEGLSHFVAASFTEDKYGVVQKNLPDILSMLLDFQTVIELRGASSGIIPKRAEYLCNSPADVQLKYRLKWAVKSSIYRLVARFQRHIMNVPLPAPQKQMLEQYLEWRVG